MDRVQELLEHVGEGKMSGPTSSTAAPSATSSPAPPKRTKKVFVYSDEDDEADAPESVTAGVAEVSCEALAIPVSEDALAELRADAHAIDAGEHDSAEDDGNGLFFCEDVLSGLGAAASAPALTASVLGSAGGGAESGRAGRMRVREVDAPALWDGALGVESAAADDAAETEEEMPALLRRGLPASTFVLESRRKRFRDTEAEGERAGSTVPAAPTGQLPTAATAAATHAATAEPTAVAAAAPSAPVGSCAGEEGGDSEEEVEVIEEVVDLRPVYDEDGETVRAVQTRGGYVLTLDERDLLEGEDEEEGEDCEGEDGDATAAAADAVDTTTPGDHDAPSSPSALEEAAEAADVDACNDDLDDLFDDEDDDDDEEEEEMDEAIVVAVVEQLVRCCEADDLDPQMALEATRFQASAKPLLADLTEERISPKEFGQKIDRDLRRFQRIYRSVYRPRDSPIVIDGVQMDM